VTLVGMHTYLCFGSPFFTPKADLFLNERAVVVGVAISVATVDDIWMEN
jgi:hypothetical protein